MRKVNLINNSYFLETFRNCKTQKSPNPSIVRPTALSNPEGKKADEI